jgi:hypothetical protein
MDEMEGFHLKYRDRKNILCHMWKLKRKTHRLHPESRKGTGKGTRWGWTQEQKENGKHGYDQCMLYT